MNYRGKLLYTVGLLFSLSAYALVVEIQTININRENAENFGVTIIIYEENGLCNDALDIYIDLPRQYSEKQLRSVNIELKEAGGTTLLETSTKIVEFKDFAGFHEFHGVTFCVAKHLLEYVHVLVAFGNAKINTHMFDISEIDGWQNEL